MRLHEVAPMKPNQKRKRVGRGPGSGLGKTSGRGQKGQKARSGGGVRPGFEGGQTTLARRLPKRGFTNFNHKEYTIVNIEDLNRFEDGTQVTPELLKSTGLIHKFNDGVKILGRGELEKKLDVTADKFSKSAREAIEKAGGTVTEVR